MKIDNKFIETILTIYLYINDNFILLDFLSDDLDYLLEEII